MEADDDEARQLEHVRTELLEEFADRVAPPVLDADFRSEVSRFDGARVRAYLPVLVRRNMVDRLRRRVRRS